MARSLLAVALATALATTAMLSATTASAETNGGALFLLRAASHDGDVTRTSWTGSTYTLNVDPTLRARWTYESMVALPTTESRERTYDINPLIHAVTYQRLNLSTLQLTFITSRSLMVADLWKGAQLSVDPKSIRSAAVTFSMAF